MSGMQKLKLDLDNFDSSEYQSLIEKVEAQGYSFYLLQALLSETDFNMKLFKLVKEGVLKSPQSDGNFESYEEFCEKLLKPSYVDVADCFVVAKQDNEWIGLTGISVDSNSGIGKSGLTVVKEMYQGNGIAKALKVLSLKQAVQLGATSVLTENYYANYPMLAINSFLGFKNDD